MVSLVCILLYLYISLYIAKHCMFVCLFYHQGVTYCGESKASSLTMQNVPWHEEVVSFVQKLLDLLPEYQIACEHEHSNCVLAANTKVWHQLNSFQLFGLVIISNFSM